MTDLQMRMQIAQDIAKKWKAVKRNVQETDEEDAQQASGVPWSREAAELTLEGWSCQVRGPKQVRIWCKDPDDPGEFWCGEEIAYLRATGQIPANPQDLKASGKGE